MLASVFLCLSLEDGHVPTFWLPCSIYDYINSKPAFSKPKRSLMTPFEVARYFEICISCCHFTVRKGCRGSLSESYLRLLGCSTCKPVSDRQGSQNNSPSTVYFGVAKAILLGTLEGKKLTSWHVSHACAGSLPMCCRTFVLVVRSCLQWPCPMKW